jgi:hypothetical protein
VVRIVSEAHSAVIRHLVAKVAPPTVAIGSVSAPPVLPFDPGLAVVAFAGVMIGAMIRVGRLISKEAPWAEIRRDMLVSALIGAGNALLVLWLHHQFDLDALQMLVAAVIAGSMGLHAVGLATDFARRLYHTAVDRLLDERSKTRAEMVEREGNLRNDVQRALSEERLKAKEEGDAPPRAEF